MPRPSLRRLGGEKRGTHPHPTLRFLICQTTRTTRTGKSDSLDEAGLPEKASAKKETFSNNRSCEKEPQKKEVIRLKTFLCVGGPKDCPIQERGPPASSAYPATSTRGQLSQRPAKKSWRWGIFEHPHVRIVHWKKRETNILLPA